MSLFMSCACKGYKPTSEIKTFNSNVKQNILNDEKKYKKNVENGTCLRHVSAFHNDVKMLFFHFFTFQRTELSVHVIFLMLVWFKHPEQFSKSFI